jgi:hypothetical protein
MPPIPGEHGGQAFRPIGFDAIGETNFGKPPDQLEQTGVAGEPWIAEFVRFAPCDVTDQGGTKSPGGGR